MKDKYVWNEEFRQKIIALCLRPGWFTRYGIHIIRPEFFELEQEQKLVASIVKFYKDYGKVPCKDELLAMFDGDNSTLYKNIRLLILAVYEARNNENLDFAQDNALTFAKEQAMKIAILESVDDIKSGVLDAPLSRVRQAMSVGMDMDDLGLELKKDVRWVYNEILGDKIPTGIHHVDMMLGGGLAKGELGTIVGDTGAGKTRALVNIGCGAANIISRCNVVHITAELSAQKVAKRYAARTVFRWVNKHDDPDEYVLDFQDAASLVMPGNVRIKDYPSGMATVQDIDNYLEQLAMVGEVVDLLVVDYPDELAHQKIGEYRQNVAHTFRELRALAKKWNIPVWGATQSTRGALGKKLVSLSDIAESYDKARISDVVLAICQTQEEADENLCRLYAAKVRDGEGGWMVLCHLDEEAHAIISEKTMPVSELFEKED